MKIIIASLLIFSLLLFGCVNTPRSEQVQSQIISGLENATVTVGPANPPAEQPAQPSPSPSPQPAPSPSGDQATQSSVKEFTMVAQQWEFQPSTITVKRGDAVKLTIRSVDVAHGFSLPEFNVDSRLEPGQDTVVEFIAERSGSFPFRCSVFCGSGHGDMRGTLVVEE